MAIVFALVAVVFFIIMYKLIRKIKNKILSILAQLGLIAAAVILMGALATVTGASTEVASQAGQYFFIMIIIYAVIKSVKKKKISEDTSPVE